MGYVRRPLLIKKRLYWWDYPQELWGSMNSDQLGGLWKEISAQPFDIILEVAARSALKAYG